MDRALLMDVRWVSDVCQMGIRWISDGVRDMERAILQYNPSFTDPSLALGTH